MYNTKQEDVMREYQKGEVTLLVIVMAGMMIGMITWMVSGGMGMGHSARHDEKPAATEQQAKTKTEPSPSFAPKESPEHRQ